MEKMKKYEDDLENKKLIDEENQSMNNRENQYRNKINGLNSKVYDNAQKYLGYVQNPNLNGDLFNAQNDFEFNRRLAEDRLMKKEAQRKDPSAINERLREVKYLLIY
jgi:hypothetical protein